MIYQLAKIAADSFLWGLLHGLLVGVVVTLLYLMFTARRDHE